MKRELLLSALVLTGGIAIAGAILAAPALAREGSASSKIQFPVAKLGNCASESSCRTYCDDPAHLEACLSFAEQNNLMSQTEAAAARKFAAGDFKGPGGCSSKESCESYCDGIAHINECVAFAEAQGFLPPEELAEARQVQSAIARGVTPPACGNKKTCDTYCRAPAHMRECIAFGEAAGFIQGKELEDAKKVVAAIEKGITPPPCGGKDECDTYCAEEANFPQCIAFAEAAGFVSKEDAERARKTGGKGPGNCRGKEECEAFCQSPSNQEACFAFAKEHGLIPEEDLHRMEEGKAKFQEGLRQAPPEVSKCLKSTVGEEVLAKLESGQGSPPRDLGEKMKACFQSFRPQGEPRPSEAFGERGFRGPGGCTSEETCRTYCESNPDACSNFGPGSGGGGAPGFMGPQGPQSEFGPNTTTPGDFRPPEGGVEQMPYHGCRTPEECAQFRNRIPEEFRRMMPGVTPMYPGPQGPEGAVPFLGGAPPSGYEGGPGPGQQYPMMQPMAPQEFQSAPPPPPPDKSAPLPSSLGPHALLGLFLNIFTGQ